MDMRINKYLSERGVCSRREADKLISEGAVLINGEKALVGQTVSENDTVTVNGNRVGIVNEKVVIALYKPVGVTVSEKDQHAKVLITDIIDYKYRLTYAGRLDKESEGLILLSNDGDFINAIMKSKNNHEKEYVVVLDKEVNQSHIDRLSKGIYIKDLDRTTKPCVITRNGKNSVKMVLTEGLNRQIRRMWKICGYTVKKLKRIRIENIDLGQLKPGQWRVIEGEELIALYKRAGMGD